MTKLYPLYDFPNLNELTQLYGCKIYDKEWHSACAKVRGKPTGEKRPPKKGEWYVSGAIPEVYRAPADLSDAHVIVKLVVVKVMVTTTETIVKE